MTELEELTAGLHAWARGSDPRVRAAVGLLASHGQNWLRSRAFVTACVKADAGMAWIAWDKAAAFERGPGTAASSSQRAVLRVAVALGSDTFRLSRMDDGQARAIVAAVADALSVEAVIAND